MKPVLTLLLVTSLFWVQAQDTIPLKKRSFKVSVYTVSGQKITGYLPSLTDTTLAVSVNKTRLLPFPPKDIATTNINYARLEMVKVRRAGATGRGILIGSFVGVITGSVIGLLSGDDDPDNNSWFCIFCLTAGEKALVGGTSGAILGGIIGAIIGATAHKKFTIGGSKPAFDKMRLSILEKINRVPLE
jgi:hypothetical protein